jgi:hypothetical protein
MLAAAAAAGIVNVALACIPEQRWCGQQEMYLACPQCNNGKSRYYTTPIHQLCATSRICGEVPWCSVVLADKREWRVHKNRNKCFYMFTDLYICTVKNFGSRNFKSGVCWVATIFGGSKLHSILFLKLRLWCFETLWAWSFKSPLEFQPCFKTPAVGVSKLQWSFKSPLEFQNPCSWCFETPVDFQNAKAVFRNTKCRVSKNHFKPV